MTLTGCKGIGGRSSIFLRRADPREPVPASLDDAPTSRSSEVGCPEEAHGHGLAWRVLAADGRRRGFGYPRAIECDRATLPGNFRGEKVRYV